MKILWYFVGKMRVGDIFLLDRNYLRRRIWCFFLVFEYEFEDKWLFVVDYFKIRVLLRKFILWLFISKFRV